jgi:hypothetical protein
MKFSVYCDVGSYSYSNTIVTGVEKSYRKHGISSLDLWAKYEMG